MLRKGFSGEPSTAQRLQAANEEVRRLQEKLQRESSTSAPSLVQSPPSTSRDSSTHTLRKGHQGVSHSQRRNPLRQAVIITAAFAVFWLIATRAIKSGQAPTVFDLIAAGDAAAVAAWTRMTPLDEQVAVNVREQWAALHAAADSGREDIVQARCCARAPRSAPSFQLQILLQAGHDANALDMHKASPLHRAAASGSTHTVSLLLKAGARLDAVDKFGATAHGWAVKYGHAHLLHALQPDVAAAATS